MAITSAHYYYYYEHIWFPILKSFIKVKQMKNNALMRLIKERLCIGIRSLKKSVNTSVDGKTSFMLCRNLCQFQRLAAEISRNAVAATLGANSQGDIPNIALVKSMYALQSVPPAIVNDVSVDMRSGPSTSQSNVAEKSYSTDLAALARNVNAAVAGCSTRYF